MFNTFRAILLLTLALPACGFADTIWVGASGANALELKGVNLTGISDGKLLYQSAGRDTTRDLTAVVRIQINDEPTFSAAEEAFAAGKFDIAATGYNSALQTTKKAWLKPRIASRLAEASQRSGRAAPAQPAGQASTSNGKAQAPAAPQASQSSPAARQHLDAAAAAIQKKDFPAAINEINAFKTLFTDPETQAQAFFTLAQAHAGLAATKNDPAAWQDAALAYMRVVAHFPQNALAPRALLATAQIEQQNLRDPAAAKLLYQQIVQQYPNDPSAATANEQLR